MPVKKAVKKKVSKKKQVAKGKKAPGKKTVVEKKPALTRYSKKERLQNRRVELSPNDKRIGNQFWKNRSKHGRDKLFATPDLLWEAACEYFEWCDDNPLIEIEFNGKDAIECELPKMRAYTLTGLCIYLDCNTAYFRQFKINLKKDDPFYHDFSTVVTRIEEVIYTQKFVGAAAGFLNSNIIVRDLGLKESTSLTVNKVGKDLADETYE